MRFVKIIDAIDDKVDDYVELFLKRYGGTEKVNGFIAFTAISLFVIIGALQWVSSSTVLSDVLSIAFAAVFVSIIVMLAFVLLRIFGVVAVLSVISGLILTFS